MPITELASNPLVDAEWWASLLRQWGDLMDQYCGLDPDDAPYWYGERALTGYGAGGGDREETLRGFASSVMSS